MKYSKSDFNANYYRTWELGFLLPEQENYEIFSVKYRITKCDGFSRVTLKASSVSDALERTCYTASFGSPWRPEDVDLHAVYDFEENLVWLDEPFYNIVQKGGEFRGMDRRSFLARFGVTSLAILYGYSIPKAFAGSTTTALSGTASNFGGQQIYSSAGSYSWLVPSGVTKVTVACVGGAGAGGTWGGGGGGGGGYCKKSNIAVTPGNTLSAVVGRGGYNVYDSSLNIASAQSSFGGIMTASGGTSVVSTSKTGGSGGTATGGDLNYSGGKGGDGLTGGPNGPNGGGGRWGGGGGAAGSSAGNGGNGANGNGTSSATGGAPAVSSSDSITYGAGGTGSTENGGLGSGGNSYGGGAGGYFHDGTSGGVGIVRIWW